MIHVVGSGIVAVLAFIAGLTFASTTHQDGRAAAQLCCGTASVVSAPNDKAE
jgi:hypothetical protein